MRSIACNPQQVAGCNHHEVMYVINPKEETYKAYALMTYRLQSKRITFAYRRLHTNPSDWIKNKALREEVLYFLEAPPRIELGIKALQASALPLGHGAVLNCCVVWAFGVNKGRLKL